MNILVAIHDSLSPIRGGGAIRTLKTAKEFRKLGHDVSIVAPSDSEFIDGIKVYNVPPATREESAIYSAAKFAVIFTSKLVFRMPRADLMFIHNAVAGFIVAIFNIVFRKKFILDVTDLHAEYVKYNAKTFLERALAPLFCKLEYWTMKRADKVIVVTEQMRQWVIKQNVPGDKVTVIYDGVDVTNFSTVKEKDAGNNIVHLGSVEKEDGVDLLIYAIPHMIKAMPQLKFYFVGGGEDLQWAKDTAKSLGIYDNCVFSGWIKYEQVKEYLMKCRIGLICRPLHPPNHMVITLKLVEYWASGTAAVSTRLKGIEEVSRENTDVVFIDALEPEKIAAKVITLVKDVKLIDKLTSEGYKSALKFGWEKIITDIVDLCLK